MTVTLVLSGGDVVAEGAVQDPDTVRSEHEASRKQIGEALESFAENTMTHIREERDLLAGRIDLPELRTDIRDRPVLMVVRGVDHKKDLRILRPYIRDASRPVGRGRRGRGDPRGGARRGHHRRRHGLRQRQALRSGAELVVHAYPDGRAPGRERLDELGLAYKVVPAPATSEDVAMLLASEKGAELIVTSARTSTSSSSSTRTAAGCAPPSSRACGSGEILVDAKGVCRLYRPTAGRGPILTVVFAAIAAFVIVIVASPNLGDLIDLLWLKLEVLLGIE